MVPRLLAAARAMRSRTCADVIQPCSSAHVRDLMVRAAANSLGTITNLEKMAAFLKVSYGARFMVKKESQTENGRKKFLD